MNGLRLIAVIFCTALMIPMIAIALSGFDATQQTNADIVMSDDVADTNISVATDDPIAWLRDRPDIHALFRLDEITAERVVIVQEVIDPDTLLGPGETAPDAAFLPLYAEARAPRRLIRYCADVLSAFATHCDLIHSETHENRQGKLVLTGRLAFRPAAVLGDPSTIADGRLVSGSIELPYSGDLRPPNDPGSRIAVMQAAQAMCDQLRATYGNCVLGRLAIDIEELWITDLEVLPADTNPQRIRASATFHVYANQATLNRGQLLTDLRKMAGV